VVGSDGTQPNRRIIFPAKNSADVKQIQMAISLALLFVASGTSVDLKFQKLFPRPFVRANLEFTTQIRKKIPLGIRTHQSQMSKNKPILIIYFPHALGGFVGTFQGTPGSSGELFCWLLEGEAFAIFDPVTSAMPLARIPIPNPTTA
jgi:hypothetical protein